MTVLLDLVILAVLGVLVAGVVLLILDTLREASWLDDHPLRETPEPCRVRLLEGDDR